VRVISSRIFRYLVFLVAVMATLYFLFLVKDILLSFFLGALIAFLLYRPVHFIESRGIRRTWAILLLYLLVLSALGLIVSVTLMGLGKELNELAELVPEYADQAQELAEQVDEYPLPKELNRIVDENLLRIKKLVYDGVRHFINDLYLFLGRILAIIFSPILAFYILNDWERIRDGGLRLFSPGARREITLILQQIDDVLFEFLKGHLTVSLFVGIATGISAALIGVKFPFLIGLIAGITNLIPYFGPFLGAIPAVAIALSQSWRLAIYMGIAIFIIQQVESEIITPKIIGEKLGLHPLVIVFALLSGGKLFGLWGLILAVPVVAVSKVIVKWGYLKLVEQ
jgi:predicted PurR-regulated permease PerM